jgi:3-oxoadipate enol-lactonase
VGGPSLAPTWVWEAGGPPGAPALLLLHGWMATAALNWYSALTYLGAHFRVVAPNLRGHGRRGKASPPFSVEGCASDLAALIGELRLQKPVVVGYSMGGAVAQVLARRHGQLLGGLALCATAANFAHRLSLRPAVQVLGKLGATAARAWPEGAAAFLAWRLARHDLALASKGVRRQEPAAGTYEERLESDLAAFIEAGAELNAYDSSPWLPTLNVPAAVVVTARDEVVSPWRQRALASLIPGARAYEVDAGHDAVVAKPDVFLPVLLDACLSLLNLAHER